MGSVAIAGLFMGGLGVVLAVMLAIASKRFYVFEDPRIDEVENLLPKSNCGACGTAGCRNFAEKVVVGEILPAQCTVNAPAQNQVIADLLGVAAGQVEKRVARLACGGGRHVAFMRAHYAGLKSCRAADAVGGGGKECGWGCLGLGDCEVVCNFDSITLNRQGLPVVDTDLCTACGDCVDVCPKHLFSIQPVGHKLWIACKNHADGDIAEASCEVACTACGKCTVDAAPDLIRLDNNLAVVDYSKNQTAAREAINRCPTGAIVWFADPNRAEKGVSAKRILRQNALPGPEAATSI